MSRMLERRTCDRNRDEHGDDRGDDGHRETTEAQTGAEVHTREPELVPARALRSDAPRPTNATTIAELDRNPRRLRDEDVPDDVRDRDRDDETDHESGSTRTRFERSP